MADYAANARTNYFIVKDVDALKADLNRYGITPASWAEARLGAEFILSEDAGNRPQGSIALFSLGSWPSLDEDFVAERLGIDDDETPVPNEHESLYELVAAHLVEGEVAVFVEVGMEKMRYLGGIALAVNSAKETRQVDLDDIYALATELTTDNRPVARAEY